MINKICNWVASYPGFAGREFTVDALAGGASAAAIYPKGEQVIARHSDILGGCAIRRKLTFHILLRSREDAQIPALIADFARWAERGAPVLGEQQTVTAEQGKLRRNTGTGITTYEIRVEMEFTTRHNN